MQRRVGNRWAFVLVGGMLAVTLGIGCMGLVRARNAGVKAVTVPITLHDGLIFVASAVNGKPVTLMLDTGAGGNVLTPEAAHRLGLILGTDQRHVEGTGGNAGTATAVHLDWLSVATANTASQTAYLIPLPEVLQCDGLLGTPFLEQWVVTVDYTRSLLTLTPRPLFSPPADAKVLPLRMIANTPHIEATVGDSSGWFEADTGDNGSLTLFKTFAAQNRLRGKYPSSQRTVTGKGAGGLTYGELLRLPEFAPGPFTFRTVPTVLSQQTTGVHADPNHAGNIGAEIWQRFTVTLDYGGGKMYLVPNAGYEQPFVGNRSGLVLDYRNRSHTILATLPNSPASEAGLQPGATITAIDDTPLAKIPPLEVRALLRRPIGTRVRLIIRRATGEERTVLLTLRDLY